MTSMIGCMRRSHVKGSYMKATVDVIEPLGSEIHLNVTSGKHNFIAVVDVQTQVRIHQEVELAVDLDKMHLFEKEAPVSGSKRSDNNCSL